MLDTLNLVLSKYRDLPNSRVIAAPLYCTGSVEGVFSTTVQIWLGLGRTFILVCGACQKLMLTVVHIKRIQPASEMRHYSIEMYIICLDNWFTPEEAEQRKRTQVPTNFTLFMIISRHRLNVYHLSIHFLSQHQSPVLLTGLSCQMFFEITPYLRIHVLLIYSISAFKSFL